jgi:predicted hydrolase (HD superfamily)
VKTLFAVDELTGFIAAVAVNREELRGGGAALGLRGS